MSNDPPARAPRVLTDAETMRALAHPVRLALLEALGVQGPLTATQAGEHIGETPTTCSFHFRQLHRFGLVEEVGGGKGRSRPWRRVAMGISFTTEQDDSQTRIAAEALSQMYRERNLARLQRWNESRGAYPVAWRRSASNGAYTIWMTPDELGELEGELQRLLGDRFSERSEDPQTRPSEALPVEILTYSFPTDRSERGS